MHAHLFQTEGRSVERDSGRSVHRRTPRHQRLETALFLGGLNIALKNALFGGLILAIIEGVGVIFTAVQT